MRVFAQCCGLWVWMVWGGAGAGAQGHTYVADADREYAAIFSWPEKPCLAKRTTSEYGRCIQHQLTYTETHLALFLTAVRGIAADDDAGAVIAGAQSRGSETKLLNRGDAAWREYERSMCGLMFKGMEGGSGAGVTEAECTYRMDRQYAQQLADAVFLKILAK